MGVDLPTVPKKTAPLRIILPDQLGLHFIDDPEQPVLLLVPMDLTFARKIHVTKAFWWLSAIYQRLEQAPQKTTLKFTPSIDDFLKEFSDPAQVIAPTSYQARKSFMNRTNIERLPSRGFITSESEFHEWIQSRAGKKLRLEDFYRFSRTKHEILLDQTGEPLGGAWNFDSENRLPPPKTNTLGLKPLIKFTSDQADDLAYKKLAELKREGYEFIGELSKDRYFAAGNNEAKLALNFFLENRLNTFGPFEDASLIEDWAMSHSLLSAPLNIGLLDPLGVVKAAEKAHKKGAPIASVEGFIRQILGWRDYVWHLYWLFGEDYVSSNNYFKANNALPDWLEELDASKIQANCLKHSISDLNERSWLHHIQRLMILGNWAMQQELNPQALTSWFDRAFIDGHPWVMAANVIGMSQYADGGKMSTKPYAAGGAYLNKMSNFCGSCSYQPQIRTGPQACPFTSGYWKFIHRHQDEFKKNPRMSQAVYGLKRLKDLDVLLRENGNLN